MPGLVRAAARNKVVDPLPNAATFQGRSAEHAPTANGLTGLVSAPYKINYRRYMRRYIGLVFLLGNRVHNQEVLRIV